MNQLCKVCGEPAAGYHFGAFTCEGCKSFFGRTYSNLSALGECKNNGQCVINKKNRTSCKSCRLKKCLVVGMSKSGQLFYSYSILSLLLLLIKRPIPLIQITTVPFIWQLFLSEQNCRWFHSSLWESGEWKQRERQRISRTRSHHQHHSLSLSSCSSLFLHCFTSALTSDIAVRVPGPSLPHRTILPFLPSQNHLCLTRSSSQWEKTVFCSNIICGGSNCTSVSTVDRAPAPQPSHPVLLFSVSFSSPLPFTSFQRNHNERQFPFTDSVLGRDFGRGRRWRAANENQGHEYLSN